MVVLLPTLPPLAVVNLTTGEVGKTSLKDLNYGRDKDILLGKGYEPEGQVLEQRD